MRKREINTITYSIQHGESSIPVKCCFLTSGLYPVEEDTQYFHPIPPLNRLFLFRKGGCVVETEDRAFRLAAGRIYLLPINQTFTVTYRGGSEFVYVHVELRDRVGLDVFRDVRGVPFLRGASGLFREIVSHYESPELSAIVRWQSGVFHALCRFCAPLMDRLHDAMVKSWRYHRLFEHIQDDLRPSLTVNELAELMHMSRSALSKGFQRHIGLSLKSYLTQLLMQQARELVGSTDMSIQEVAYEMGYGDPYYFYRTFKKNVGWTPLQYRRTVRAGMYEPRSALAKRAKP